METAAMMSYIWLYLFLINLLTSQSISGTSIRRWLAEVPEARLLGLVTIGGSLWVLPYADLASQDPQNGPFALVPLDVDPSGPTFASHSLNGFLSWPLN